MSSLQYKVCKMLIQIIIHLGLLLSVTYGAQTCYSGVFQPRCQTNEMLVIREAFFGRKTLDNCLSDEGTPNESNLRDPNFVGCFADVRDIVGSQCAGKPSCDLIISEIKATTSCHRYLKHYLFAEYDCIAVVSGNGQCSIKASNVKQHIFSLRASKADCGSQIRPWNIEATAGQKITVSILRLIETSAPTQGAIFFQPTPQLSSCQVVGQVTNSRTSKRSAKICSGRDSHKLGRLAHYVSEGNIIEISFDDLVINKDNSFLFGIEATGCSDLIPPADAWLKRTENEAIIGCYSTRLRWQLKCQGQRWIGVIGNCSQGENTFAADAKSSSEKEVRTPESQVVPIVAISMLGFVVCFMIICLGVVFLNRHYAVSKSKFMKQASLYNNGDNNGLIYNNDESSNRPVYDDEKTKLSNIIGADNMFPNNNTTLLADENIQYFELDQALVNKERIG